MDGDILRLGIPSQYCNAYAQICDAVEIESCTKTVAKGLKKTLEKFGIPLDILNLAHEKLDPLISCPIIQLQSLHEIEMDLLYKVGQLKSKNTYTQQAGDIALKVVKRVINQIEQKKCSHDLQAILYDGYVSEVLNFSFSGPFSSIQHHLTDMPIEIVIQHKNNVVDQMMPFIKIFSNQIKNGKKLTMPRSKRKNIDLNDIIN